MPGSRLLACGASLRELGVRGEMVQQSRHSPPGRAAGNWLAAKYGDPVLIEASHDLSIQDHHQLWLPVWLPNDHLVDHGMRLVC